MGCRTSGDHDAMTQRSRNPWIDLPEEPPYVLPLDRPYVEAFNRHVGNDYQLRLNLLPEPFIGNKRAPVVLLNRNPGFRPAEHCGASHPLVRTDHPRGHLCEPTNGSAPRSHSRVGTSARRGLVAQMLARRDRRRSRTRDTGCPRTGDRVSRHHSRRWRALPVTLPSQAYGFSLVERAMNRGAMVVIMRGLWDWEVAVPALGDYAQRVVIRNPRSSTISERNCGSKPLKQILAALA